MTTKAVTTKDQFNAVVEFMTVAGQEVNSTFTEPTTKVGNFRLALIKEEMQGANELFDSIQNDNMEMILDGICDVLYVAYGAYATFGIEPIEYVISPQDDSTSKLMTMSYAATAMKHVVDGYEQTNRGLLFGDEITIQKGLNNIVLSCLQIALAHNMDVIGAFKEVHASNMSKFCTSADECARSIYQRQTEGKTDYDGAEGFEVRVGDASYFVIRRAKDGKVLKGTNFFEPDLTKFINA